MSRMGRWEYIRAIYQRYRKAPRRMRHQMLNEFCQVCGYHRKYAIRLLNGPAPEKPTRRPRRRAPRYGPEVIGVLVAVWEAAGYPCGTRLKALLPLWLPWASKRLRCLAQAEPDLLRISPATIDRRLASKKRSLKKRCYGRTKPGTLLKHQIPIMTQAWDVQAPGFTEIDLVSHSGNSARGEFIHSLNVTDLHTTWVETRAVMGKGEHRVMEAIREIQGALPFRLRAIDSDNGSEFINYHLKRYCDRRLIQFTRGRPYKKDDNAHVEQKNWTHVRKLLGYLRYDSPAALQAINELYTGELRLLQNLFLPSVKLQHKVRIASRLKRKYDRPKTPFERVCACSKTDSAKLQELKRLREQTDPFALAQTIDQKLQSIYRLASDHSSPRMVRYGSH